MPESKGVPRIWRHFLKGTDSGWLVEQVHKASVICSKMFSHRMLGNNSKHKDTELRMNDAPIEKTWENLIIKRVEGAGEIAPCCFCKGPWFSFHNGHLTPTSDASSHSSSAVFRFPWVHVRGTHKNKHTCVHMKETKLEGLSPEWMYIADTAMAMSRIQGLRPGQWQSPLLVPVFTNGWPMCEKPATAADNAAYRDLL